MLLLLLYYSFFLLLMHLSLNILMLQLVEVERVKLFYIMLVSFLLFFVVFFPRQHQVHAVWMLVPQASGWPPSLPPSTRGHSVVEEGLPEAHWHPLHLLSRCFKHDHTVFWEIFSWPAVGAHRYKFICPMIPCHTLITHKWSPFKLLSYNLIHK